MNRRSILCLAVLAGCAGDRPIGLAPVVRQGGPRVKWDLDAKPLPEIPLPNDVATILDASSPTGRRLNVAVAATTYLETDLRAKADRLDGFGVFMPITVAFEDRLDLQNILTRHRNADTADDVMYLLNVTAGEHFGERVPLDLGGGVFPVVLERPDNYFASDPRGASMNLLYETVQEDRNCNGVLDPGEDTDFDGHLDRPNTFGLEWHEDANCNGKLDLGEDWDCDGTLDANAEIVNGLPEDVNGNGTLDAGEDLDCDGQLDTSTSSVALSAAELRRSREDRALTDHLTMFYEQESNTLIARPIVPLRERSTYAVVITNRLTGENGMPVESPFPYTTHAGQKQALEGLPQALSQIGVSIAEVAFAWSYTTGSTTFEMEQIRRGLYGTGPFARLGAEFPVESLQLERVRDDDDAQPFIARADDLSAILPVLASALELDGDIDGIETVSHIVIGSFATPNFMVDKDGIATPGYPADDDESFDLDPLTGRATIGPGKVTFWCAIPKDQGKFGQPYPVQIFGHGYGSSKFEMLPMVGRFSKFGIASCAIDAFGHGTGPAATGTIDLGSGPQNIKDVAYQFLHGINLGNFALAALLGRDRDLDNNGVGDPGGDFWTADLFHTRDAVRQSVIDHVQFIRILRAFDGRTSALDTNSDGKNDLAGDFDGDGRIDLGGGGVRYSMWGSSLGGILSSVTAGLEPALDAAAPHAGGSGLNDIGIRSTQGGVPEAVFMPLFGPFVVFEPGPGPEDTSVRFLVNNVASEGSYPFYRTTAIRAGDRVVLRNLHNGKSQEAIVPGDRRFRLAVAADALTATEKRPLLGYPEAPAPGFDQTTPAPAAPVAPPVVLDPTALGDALAIDILDGVTGQPRGTIDTFGQDVTFQGARYPKGATLVALAKGLGFTRNSPDVRRFLGIASMVLQGADPVSYAPHYWAEPLASTDYDPAATPGTNVLVIPMTGDMNVPCNTGIETAVAAGTVAAETPDPRYGTSPLRVIVDNHVIEAIERLGRYEMDIEKDVGGCTFDGTTQRVMGLFDLDDLDEGLSEFRAPGLDVPLRATVRSSDGVRPDAAEHCNPGAAVCGTVFTDPAGINAMRSPYTIYKGEHDFPGGCRKFKITRYMMNLIATFFASGGTVLHDDVCLATDDCDFFPWVAK